MFFNNLIIAWRNLRKARLFSLITILGLSISLASCVLIIFYVHNEMTYDHFHPKADQTFRISSVMKYPGGQDHMAISPDLLGPMMKTTYNQIENYVRFDPFTSHQVKFQNEVITEEGFSKTDPQVFDVFGYQLLEGNPDKALRDPAFIVISETVARRYFGQESALNKTMIVDERPYTVTGVFKDLPQNSSLPKGALMGSVPPDLDTKASWRFNAVTYVVADAKIDNAALEALLSEFASKNKMMEGVGFQTQRLTDLHFITDIKFDAVKGNKNYVYGFAATAVVLLALVLFNYINLSTVRSMERNKEVGIRKVIGARPGQLISQFLQESIVILGISILLAILLIEVLQPGFTLITGKELLFNWSNGLPVVAATMLILVTIAVISSLYPAWVMSSFRPVSLLRGRFSVTRGRHSGNPLLLAQFALCSSVLISFVIIGQQVNYIKKYDLGFAKEGLVGIHLPTDSAFQTKLGYFATELGKSGFKTVSFTSASGNLLHGEPISEQVKISSGGQTFELKVNPKEVDAQFIPLMKIPLVRGKSFTEFSPGQWTTLTLVNESFVQQAGWTDGLNEKIELPFGLGTLTVIGVIKDFHITSLHNPIEPVMVRAWDFRNLPYQQLKASPPVASVFMEASADELPEVKKIWDQTFATATFDYYFLEEAFEKQYEAEQKTISLFFYFSIVSLVITGMGLYGLMAYQVELRTKEIGIRKIMGANLKALIKLLSRDTSGFILVGSAFGLLISYKAGEWWLQGFAYKTTITFTLMAIPVVTLLVVAAIIISAKVLHASRANPVDALRNE